MAGLTAVLREESNDRSRRGARLACQAILTTLATDPPTPPDQLEKTMHALLDHSQPGDITAVYQAFRRGLMPVDAALQVLAAFGAVDNTVPLRGLRRRETTTPDSTTTPHGGCDLNREIPGTVRRTCQTCTNVPRTRRFDVGSTQPHRR